MARSVGLDIGSRLLKIADVSGSAKGLKVHRLIVRPVPEGTGEEADAAMSALLRQAFAEAKLPKDDVCLSFPAGATVLREITVPFHEDAQIEKVVRYEAENHLHGRAIEDVVINWVKTGTTKEGSQILVFASPKADLARLLSVVRAAGIEPASVDLDATALFAACDATGVFRDHPSVVIVEIGARTTNLLVVDGGRLRMVRSFLAGAEAVGHAVGADLELPPAEAAARALRPKGPDPDALVVPASEHADAASGEAGKSLTTIEGEAVDARRAEFGKRLQRELTRSLTAARGETPPDRILVTGGGSLLPGIADSLRERFGMPVEPLDLLGRLRYRPHRDEAVELASAAGAVAVGCGARLLGVDPLGIELRRDEFAPTNTFDVVKGAMAVAVSLLFCLLLVLAWAAKERWVAERNAFHTVVEKAKQTIFKEAEKKFQQHVNGKDEGAAKLEADRAAASIPNDHTALGVMKSRLTRHSRFLQGQLGLSTEIPRIHSALEVMAEMYAALNTIDRKSLGWFRLNKLGITQTSATMQVEAESEAAVDRVQSALLASPYLKGRVKDPRKPIRGAVNPVPNDRIQANFEWQFKED